MTLCLVTGGAGFLGQHVVELLMERGLQVRSMGRGQQEIWKDESRVEIFRGDIRSKDDIQKACKNVDVIFHTAAIAGMWGPKELYESINVTGTMLLLNEAKRIGIEHFIFTSSPSVIFDGKDHQMIDEDQPYPQQYLTHYPQTKAKAEQLVMKANGQEGESQKKLKTTSLRPHLIIGQQDPHLIPRLVQRAQKGRLRQVGDGKNIVDMVHVKNAAMAHLNAYDAQLQGKACGQAYFITNDEPTQLWPWVQELLKELNVPFSQRPVSAKLAHRIGAALEWIYRSFNISAEPPMTRFIARQLACHHSYNIEKAKRDLNYQPSISMDEATQEIIQWMKTKL